MGEDKRTSDMKEFLKETVRFLQELGYVKVGEIPDIDLYMDQVTTFLDEHLRSSKRHENDKLLTKTMINNYTKNDLLPPPEKKKYSREHMMTLIFIYYFKHFLSFHDIHMILDPLTQKYFGNEDGFNMADIYSEVFRFETEEIKKFLKNMARSYKTAMDSFNDFPEEDREYLHTFSFICQLSFDIYLKKMILEHILDGLDPDGPEED